MADRNKSNTARLSCSNLFQACICMAANSLVFNLHKKRDNSDRDWILRNSRVLMTEATRLDDLLCPVKGLVTVLSAVILWGHKIRMVDLFRVRKILKHIRYTSEAAEVQNRIAHASPPIIFVSIVWSPLRMKSACTNSSMFLHLLALDLKITLTRQRFEV